MNNSSTMAESLQRAIITLLSSDSVLNATLSGIFDYVPTKTPYPYITVHMDFWENYSAGAQKRLSKHSTSVHLWSDYDGNAQLFNVIQRVELLLSNPTLSVAGGSIVNITLRKTELSPPDITRKRHASLHYDSIIEHS